VAARDAGIEAASVHREPDAVGVADREHQQRYENARVAARGEAADPARLSQGRQILGQSRHRAIRCQSRVGEAVRHARSLDQGIGEGRRPGGQGKDDARDPDRPDAKSQCRGGRDCLTG
jgi:hypothetical protein